MELGGACGYRNPDVRLPGNYKFSALMYSPLLYGLMSAHINYIPTFPCKITLCTEMK